MASTKGYFQTKQHALNYKKYRSEMPPELLSKILNYLSLKFEPKKCIAVDVGCGSGQGTLPLAPHLAKIIGIDASGAQLAEAKSDPRAVNVEFKVGKAECIPLGDSSVHLVVAMHAAHWFEMDAFLKEADRVLVSGGVLAIGDAERGFHFPGFEEEFQAYFEELKEGFSKYWPDHILKKDKMYQELQMCYPDAIRESVAVKFRTTLDFFIGRLKSLSGIGKFLDECPDEAEKLITTCQNKMLKMLDSPNSADQTLVTYVKMYILVLGRKP